MPRPRRCRLPELRWFPIPPSSSGPTSSVGMARIGRCNKPARLRRSNLGAPLTADAIKKNLPAGAKLWVNLPPSKELAAKLTPAGTDSADSACRQFDERDVRAYRRSHCKRSRLRVVPQKRTRCRAAVAQCAGAQPWLLCHVAVSGADRLGACSERGRHRRREYEAEQLFIAACQGAWLA